MTELSPQAQAVLDAFTEDNSLHDWKHNHYNIEALAAALRAAADQVVPVEISFHRGMRPGGTGSIAPDEFKQDQRQDTRRKLFAIAAELEGKGND